MGEGGIRIFMVHSSVSLVWADCWSFLFVPGYHLTDGMTTMSVAFAPRPEDEIKYYGQVDNSHRSIHDPTLYPEQPEAAGVRTATFLKKSG